MHFLADPSLRGTKQSLHMPINRACCNCRAEIASCLAMTRWDVLLLKQENDF